MPQSVWSTTSTSGRIVRAQCIAELGQHSYLPNGQSVGYPPSTSQVYYKTPDASGQMGVSLELRHIF